MCITEGGLVQIYNVQCTQGTVPSVLWDKRDRGSLQCTVPSALWDKRDRGSPQLMEESTQSLLSYHTVDRRDREESIASAQSLYPAQLMP